MSWAGGSGLGAGFDLLLGVGEFPREFLLVGQGERIVADHDFGG